MGDPVDLFVLICVLDVCFFCYDLLSFFLFFLTRCCATTVERLEASFRKTVQYERGITRAAPD